MKPIERKKANVYNLTVYQIEVLLKILLDPPPSIYKHPIDYIDKIEIRAINIMLKGIENYTNKYVAFSFEYIDHNGVLHTGMLGQISEFGSYKIQSISMLGTDKLVHTYNQLKYYNTFADFMKIDKIEIPKYDITRLNEEDIDEILHFEALLFDTISIANNYYNSKTFRLHFEDLDKNMYVEITDNYDIQLNHDNCYDHNLYIKDLRNLFHELKKVVEEKIISDKPLEEQLKHTIQKIVQDINNLGYAGIEASSQEDKIFVKFIDKIEHDYISLIENILDSHEDELWYSYNISIESSQLCVNITIGYIND